MPDFWKFLGNTLYVTVATLSLPGYYSARGALFAALDRHDLDAAEDCYRRMSVSAMFIPEEV